MSNNIIPPDSFVFASYAPPPTTLIPPRALIPWIGARVEWMNVWMPMPDDLHARAFYMVGVGSDGFAEAEGAKLGIPMVVVRAENLREIVARGGVES